MGGRGRLEGHLKFLRERHRDGLDGHSGLETG